MNKEIIKRSTCRISNEKLVPLFSLGKLHLSDFVSPTSEVEKEKVELKVCLAPKSGLVQLAHTASLDDMYRQYWYRAGISNTMRNELQQIATSTQALIKIGPGDLFIDVGCNDGTMFSYIDPSVIRVGFDPAKNDYATESSKHANLIVEDYFNYAAFKKSKYGNMKAKAITSIAMFYDLEDPHKFVSDVYKALNKDGLWVVQMSYMPLMLKQLAFDNILHEHLEYYSLTAFKYLVEKHGFKMVDCQLNDINGGSFRVYLMKKNADLTKFATTPYRDVAEFRVESLQKHEKTLKLDKVVTYKKFYKSILALKKKTVDFIKKEKAKGKTIWGYGASTKGNTLLQWYGLDNTLIDAIAERFSGKYGLKTAGTNIPIKSEEEMRKAQPDYLLILPWHFIKEFRQREVEYLKKGGKFIVPCPKFEIISK